MRSKERAIGGEGRVGEGRKRGALCYRPGRCVAMGSAVEELRPDRDLVMSVQRRPTDTKSERNLVEEVSEADDSFARFQILRWLNAEMKSIAMSFVETEPLSSLS